MTCSGRSAVSRASSTSASMKSVMPLTSACSSRLSTGRWRQTRSCALWPRARGALEPLGQRQQAFGRVVAPVQHDILAGLA